MTYSTILFDIDGTLFDFERAQAEALRATFESQGAAYRPEFLPEFQRINVAAWQEFERGAITQEQLRGRRFERLFEAVGSDLSDPEEFGERYLDQLSERGHLLDGARELIESLHSRFSMAIITNGIPRVQNARIDRSGLRGFFAAVVISGEVGVAKPDPRIFDMTLEQLGRPERDSVLMIGDSLTSDIRGAVGFGIDACWLRPAHAAAEDHGARYEVETLAEFAVLLGLQ
ncbi:MAG: YjjG family noncanonical pyrimidine nucleotidase [Planctomycetota bacterium]